MPRDAEADLGDRFRRAIADAIKLGGVPSPVQGFGPYTVVALTAIAHARPDATADMINSAYDAFLSEHRTRRSPPS